MKKILVLTNSINGLYSFRRELIIKLIKEGYQVSISAPKDLRSIYFREIGCDLIDTLIKRRGTNPLADIRLLVKYLRIIKQIKPDLVLTYTIKPNVYGGMICSILKTPYIATITGLGTSIENNGFLRRLSLSLYKHSLGKAARIFFQNKANRDLFTHKKLVRLDKVRLIPGSGVNLDDHCMEKYPEEDGRIRFLYLGRIMKDKGINELFKAAQIVKRAYPNVEFHLVGDPEEDYQHEIDSLVKNGVIHFHGYQKNVHSFLRNSHAIINPSYHEGMSNVLLEAAATGRPILASKVPGCEETYDEGISGLGFAAKNVADLVDSIIKFINLPYVDKERMGLAGRDKMEREFDRNQVVSAYLEEIQQIAGRL